MEIKKQSKFSILKEIPYEPIIEIVEMYLKCPSQDKISLAVGAARDDNSNPIIFNSVHESEKRVVSEGFSREYLSPLGDLEFANTARELLFDNDSEVVKEKRVLSLHSISGSGSLRVAANFIRKFLTNEILVPDPTWINHFPMFRSAGFNMTLYNYYDPKTNKIDISSAISTIKSAKEGSCILIHACGHNPTGIDPTKEQWLEIVNAVKEKKLVTLFDLAYHGFVTGDFIDDAYPIYLFLEHKQEFFVAQSFAKNLGLYGERVGALHIVSNKSENIPKIKKQITNVAMGIYLTPLGYGAKIAMRVIKDEELKKKWYEDFGRVVERIKQMRFKLYEFLVKHKAPGSWEHIIVQRGMFTYSGLTENQCNYLMEKHHIFLMRSGRISIPGINTHNVERIALSIKDTVETIKN